MKEIWATPKSFPNYEASNLGRVRNKKTGRILRGSKQSRGYRQISLTHEGKVTVTRVHRLIIEAFIPQPKGKKSVNHKDGDKQNNVLSNLEWCNHSENAIHAYQTGLCSNKGDTHYNRKLTDVDIKQVRVLLSENHSIKELAEKYQCSDSLIYIIKNNKNYRGVS